MKKENLMAFFLTTTLCGTVGSFARPVNPVSTHGVQQQTQGKVKGNVVDQNGEPIVGASVLLKGTSNGTVTDLDGNFIVSNVPEDGIIVVSYVGFITRSISVSGKSKLNIVLEENKQVLNEVIVTGYGSVTRKNLTTSIVKVKGDDVIKTGTTNMAQMLVGRAAGLQATLSSAQPGGGVAMTVRGGGSPLCVVDGIVMPSASLEAASGGSILALPSNVNRSGLADINPDDIESIEVLKDASAAIYGVNAANGVILVTTKKGRSGKVRVTYDGAVSVVDNYKYLQPLNAQDYMRYVNAFGKENYLFANKMGVYGSNAYDGGYKEAFSETDIANAKNTEWQDEVLRTGSISSHNVNVQGGTGDLQYYLSGNYYNQVGTVKGSDFERYVLRSNISANIFKWLKLTTSINYNKNRNNNGMVGGTGSGRGSQANGTLASAMSFPSYQPIYNEDGTYNTMGDNFNNPVALNSISDISVSDGFLTNISLDVTFIPGWLSGRFVYGYNKESSERKSYIPSDVYYDQVKQSRGSIQNAHRSNSTLEGTLSFDHSLFNDKMTVNAVFGMGRYFNKTNGLGIAYTDSYDAIGNDNIAVAQGTKIPTSYRTETEKRSQFGRINLDFYDRYSVSATLRRDGTDKFFSNKKYSLFPSVAVAWKIFNEKFMKDLSWVNMFKLRLSYGVTGNDVLNSDLYGGYFARSLFVKFDNNSTSYTPFELKSIDYPNVTWEKTKMKNVGFDFSLFNDRINGSFDYFVNDVTNMLTSSVGEGMSMFTTYPSNSGHKRRYGWDATLNTTNVMISDFKWESTLTLSCYNSIWKERYSNYDYKEYQQRNNEPVNALYFYRTAGIVNSDKSNMPSCQPESLQNPGCPIIKDLNDDGQITIDDVDMVNVIPSLYLGWGNTVTYKNWDLTVFVYSQLGLKKYNYAYDWISVMPTTATSQNVVTLIKDCYNSETNPSGSLPGYAFYNTSYSLPGGAGTDLNYEEASFLRVRNITLAYTFNAKSLGALNKYINGLRVYVDALNPFTFTGFRDFDPEVTTGGNYKGGKAEYPMTRTFSFGVKLQF